MFQIEQLQILNFYGDGLYCFHLLWLGNDGLLEQLEKVFFGNPDILF
jgi:hypothetical protein